MKLSAFGREARKLRIDGGLMLAAMAAYLDTSPSYLSSVETGRKPVSEALVQKSIEFFAQHGIDAAVVLRAAAEQDKRALSIEQLQAPEREAMFALARVFPEARSQEERERRLQIVRQAIESIETEKEPA